MTKIYSKEESLPLEERLLTFCKENNISFKNNTDLTKICNIFEIDTVAMPLDDENLDGVILIDNEVRVIATNKSLDVQDSRFVMAHELAHFITKSVAHQSGQLLFAERDRVFHGGAKKPEEHDMDYLAAAILVPKEQFLDELKLLNIDLTKLEKQTEDGVKQLVNDLYLEILSHRYNVKEDVIIRRVAEVACYV